MRRCSLHLLLAPSPSS